MSFIDKLTGRNAASDQSAQTDQTDVNQTSSDTSAEENENTTAAVPLENRIAELARKTGKTDKTLSEMSSLMNQLVENVSKLSQAQVNKQAETSYDNDDDDATYAVDPRVNTIQKEISEFKQESLNERYLNQFEQAKEVYTSLDPDSDSYDDKFYKEVDKYFIKFSQAGEKDAVNDAVQLAAAKLGKFQELEQEKAIKDNIRRSRLIGEGGMPASKTTENKEPEVPSSVSFLASKLPSLKGLNSNQLKKLMR